MLGNRLEQDLYLTLESHHATGSNAIRFDW